VLSSSVTLWVDLIIFLHVKDWPKIWTLNVSDNIGDLVLSIRLTDLKWSLLFIYLLFLRWWVAGLSPRRPGFDPRLVRIRSLLDREALEQVFLRALLFFLSVSFHQCSVVIIFLMLPLPEGQTVETGVPSDLSHIWGALNVRILSHCSLFFSVRT
jgi:hypothetical protein